MNFKAMNFAIASLVLSAVQANIFYFGHELGRAEDEPFERRFDQLEERRTGRGVAWDTWDCQNVTLLPDDIRAEFPLANFYRKYTHAYGIPIISSDAPQDAALTRACYVVRFLLADRKDVRDAMYDSYGRVGVIGEHEKTTDIPEHSYLSDLWNQRARALGGIPSRPISTDGEENLLCADYWHDGWWEEDVLVHEFSHAIHLVALREADATFNQRLEDTYREATQVKGLWKGTYSRQNHREYFAEGVQAFFNVKTRKEFIDDVNNLIYTREALHDYDRPLYDLIAEVFPCKNIIVDRCDNQDLAAKQKLRMDCD
ncbi:uncharacterized protein LOC110981000 [Acanthaster planci]|uniref:Uncharacterized protein LOC110981000 n=1 Tax=Acanthaster planci TaxID=133434 RepID=A0A8B7YQW2_ACAPL|nr:uncharacterized protein LOC110981000 [Acanthaster planci]